jgi:hypothetical protein
MSNFLRALLPSSLFLYNRPYTSDCEENHNIKMPYIPYHKFIRQPWQTEMREKLMDVCLELKNANKYHKHIRQVADVFHPFCLKE